MDGQGDVLAQKLGTALADDSDVVGAEKKTRVSSKASLGRAAD